MHSVTQTHKDTVDRQPAQHGTCGARGAHGAYGACGARGAHGACGARGAPGAYGARGTRRAHTVAAREFTPDGGSIFFFL